MILPDANLLLYAYDQSSLFHPKAAAWCEDIMTIATRFVAEHFHKSIVPGR